MPRRSPMKQTWPNRLTGHPRTAVAIYLVASLFVGAGAAAGVSALLALAAASLDFPGAVDVAALHALAELRSETWDHAVLAITALGNTLTLVVLLIWIGGLLQAHGHGLAAGVLLVAYAGGRVFTEILKAGFGRARPDAVEWLSHATSPAFPSAHAMSATIVFGGLAYVLGRTGAGPLARGALWVLAATLIVSVSVSRVYLGVHYPTDVVAGVVAGAVWTAILLSTLPVADRQLSRR